MKTSVFGLETTFYLLIVSKLISLPFQRCIIVLIKYLKWLSYVKIKQSAFFTKNASFLLHFLTFSLRISVMNKLRALKIWIFLSQNVYFREKNTKKYLEKVTFLKLGHPMYHSALQGPDGQKRSAHPARRTMFEAPRRAGTEDLVRGSCARERQQLKTPHSSKTTFFINKNSGHCPFGPECEDALSVVVVAFLCVRHTEMRHTQHTKLSIVHSTCLL